MKFRVNQGTARLKIKRSDFTTEWFGLRVYGLGFRVYGLGFKAEGLVLEV